MEGRHSNWEQPPLWGLGGRVTPKTCPSITMKNLQQVFKFFQEAILLYMICLQENNKIFMLVCYGTEDEVRMRWYQSPAHSFCECLWASPIFMALSCFPTGQRRVFYTQGTNHHAKLIVSSVAIKATYHEQNGCVMSKAQLTYLNILTFK